MAKQDNEKLTNVNILVGEQGNNLLTNAAHANHRSKRKEAAARLEHHLRTFGSDSTKALLKNADLYFKRENPKRVFCSRQ
ncbi:TraY domain-containing protein [Photobacterium damselae subsp. piscicida]|nr:TraY domain-containing protein [Photobacterium damselae subsp. piscicida]